VPRYAAFLRAINVTGRRVTSAELVEPFVACGLREVAAFRASGNVVFDAGDEPAGELTARVEAALKEALGYEVATFLRSEDEVRHLAAHEPFDAKTTAAVKGKLQIDFLAGRPPAKVRKQVLALATDDDRLAFGERELYWLPKDGTQTSDLDLKAIERLLGPGTRRTKGTVEALHRKFFAI